MFKLLKYRMKQTLHPKILFSLACLFCFLTQANARGIPDIQEITILFDKLYFAKDDATKVKVNQELLKKFERFIIYQDDFSGLKKIKNLSFVHSRDERVCVFTWAVLPADNRYKYYGFVRYYDEISGEYIIEQLIDNPKYTMDDLRQVLPAEKWYGALYYDLAEERYKGEKYYVLMGWDGNDLFTDKKIIEALHIADDEYLELGEPIFETPSGIQNRMILEYGENIGVLLKYNREARLIVWDHLSPSRQELKGNYRYYGPDFTLDAFQFEEGKWKYIADVELK